MGEIHEMSAYDIPSGALLDEAGNLTPSWAQWIQRTHSNAITAQQSGPTADRPDSLLWVGRVFFDTTLNKPVWLKAINPNVWVDGVGTVS